jgi:hypothetical protein
MDYYKNAEQLAILQMIFRSKNGLYRNSSYPNMFHRRAFITFTRSNMRLNGIVRQKNALIFSAKQLTEP